MMEKYVVGITPKTYYCWTTGFKLLFGLLILTLPIEFMTIFIARVWEWGPLCFPFYLILAIISPLLLLIIFSRIGYIYLKIIINLNEVYLVGMGRKDKINRDITEFILAEKPSVWYKTNDQIGRLLGAQLKTGELVHLSKLEANEVIRREIELEILNSIRAPIKFSNDLPCYKKGSSKRQLPLAYRLKDKYCISYDSLFPSR